MLDFIVYFDRKYLRIWRCPLQLEISETETLYNKIFHTSNYNLQAIYTSLVASQSKYQISP